VTRTARGQVLGGEAVGRQASAQVPEPNTGSLRVISLSGSPSHSHEEVLEGRLGELEEEVVIRHRRHGQACGATKNTTGGGDQGVYDGVPAANSRRKTEVTYGTPTDGISDTPGTFHFEQGLTGLTRKPPGRGQWPWLPGSRLTDLVEVIEVLERHHLVQVHAVVDPVRCRKGRTLGGSAG
jgi:hypothetical protein